MLAITEGDLTADLTLDAELDYVVDVIIAENLDLFDLPKMTVNEAHEMFPSVDWNTLHGNIVKNGYGGEAFVTEVYDNVDNFLAVRTEVLTTFITAYKEDWLEILLTENDPNGDAYDAAGWKKVKDDAIAAMELYNWGVDDAAKLKL